MKRGLLALGLVLLVTALHVAVVSAEHCAGAYDPKVGTNFSVCPGPKH